MKDTRKSGKSGTAVKKTFTAEEREAIQERAREVKAAERRGPRADDGGEDELLAKIAEMRESDRAMASRIHAVLKASAPARPPRTWNGVPPDAQDRKTAR